MAGGAGGGEGGGRVGGGNPSQLLLHLIISLQRVLQLGRDLLEEGDLSAQVLLHLAAEVADPGAVEVLDLGQCGTGDDVAALLELALLLGAVLHLGQRTLQRDKRHVRSRWAEREAENVCFQQRLLV